jgi:hypothetical protein
MGKIQLGKITEEFRNGLDLDSSRTGIYPNESSDKIVLTYDYSNAKKIDIYKSGTQAVSGSTIAYAIPQGFRLYITYSCISFTADAASDANTIYLRMTAIDGQVWDIYNLRHTTGAIEHINLSNSYNLPLVAEESTNIVINQTSTAGTSSTRAQIAGYLVPK